jgi:PD-(D/E)XK nuclease superfamily protein
VEHPKDIGDRTTLAVMLALREVGLAVLVPFGENTRYDLVIDDGARLMRVQCKTGRLRKGAVLWSMCSNYGHHAKPRVVHRDYQGEVDYFGVFCPETQGIYLIPIDDVPMKRQGSLRITPSKNNQRRFIRDANRYEIGRVRVTRPIPDSNLSGVDERVG